MAVTHIHPSTYDAGSSFVVRIAGMAIDALDRLRVPRTVALIDQVLELDRGLAQHRDALCDALHALIGGNADTASRRRLIALRRDIHGDRVPRAGVPDRDAVPALSSDLADALAHWHRQVVRRRELLAAAERELASEAQDVRAALRGLAADPNLRAGLVLASPSLSDTLAGWLASSAPRLDRKLERRLARYVTRAASKTSPYSTFTSSTEGRWSTGHAALRCATTSSLTARRSVVELNAFVQRQLRRGIAALPELRPHLRLTVTGSMIEAGGVIRFLGRQGQEAVIELATTPTLQRFLAEVRDAADPSYRAVVQRLAQGDAGNRQAEIVRFLDKLIDLGLFEVALEIADGALDPLGELDHALRRFEGPRVAALADRVATLRGELARYGQATLPAERIAQAGAIQRALAGLYEALGWDPTGAEFPSHPFYEDTLVPGAVVECSAPAWSGVLDDLNLVQQLAGAFDRFLPGRIAAAAFFEDHYGRGATVPLIELYGAFCRELRQPAGARPDRRITGADLLTCYERPYPVPPVGLERLAALAEVQRRVTAYFASLPVEHTAAGATCRAAPAALRALIAGFPAFVRPIESTAFHCQVIPGRGQPQVVLNELVMGFGRSRARLHRLDDVSGGGVFTRAAPPRRGRGRCHAEIAGAMTSNLNLRAATAAFEIGYPGSVSDRPADERIALNDLVVEHNVQTGELGLRSRRLGVEITPVHVGAMVEFLLPSAYRFLIQMFGQAVPRFEFVKTLASASAYAASDTVRRFPRLYVGDVVVSRAAWAIDAAHVPRHAKGETELARLIRAQQWRRALDLPERCFVRTFGIDFARPSMDALLDKSRKPQLIDLASPVLLDVLDHLPAEAGRMVVFEEMLPAPADAVVRDATGGYVSELVIELTMRTEAR